MLSLIFHEMTVFHTLDNPTSSSLEYVDAGKEGFVNEEFFKDEGYGFAS